MEMRESEVAVSLVSLRESISVLLGNRVEKAMGLEGVVEEGLMRGKMLSWKFELEGRLFVPRDTVMV